METFSAFHVSTGPTVIALVGTIEMFPPPLVRAFCAIVSGWSSTTRVVNLRYSSGVGGCALYLSPRGNERRHATSGDTHSCPLWENGGARPACAASFRCARSTSHDQRVRSSADE